jgi:hypothetical protein
MEQYVVQFRLTRTIGNTGDGIRCLGEVIIVVCLLRAQRDLHTNLWQLHFGIYSFLSDHRDNRK